MSSVYLPRATVTVASEAPPNSPFTFFPFLNSITSFWPDGTVVTAVQLLVDVNCARPSIARASIAAMKQLTIFCILMVRSSTFGAFALHSLDPMTERGYEKAQHHFVF